VSCKGSSTVATPEKKGPHIRTREEIDPTFALDKHAKVTSAGLARPMDVDTDLDDNEYIVRLELHGEEYDEEVYKDLPGSFSLSQAAGEMYDLPIPLLKFPMQVGDTWNWEGAATAAGESSPATAVVKTDEEEIFVCGVAVQAVRTSVTISIVPRPGAQPIDREMTFYFAPKRGLFKRSWGNTSIREPDCP
jgi:hypothetical protein